MKYIRLFETVSYKTIKEFQKCVGKYVIFLLKYPNDTKGAGTTNIFLCKITEILKSTNMNGTNTYYLDGLIYEDFGNEWFDFHELDITNVTFINSFTNVEEAKSEYHSFLEANKYNL